MQQEVVIEIHIIVECQDKVRSLLECISDAEIGGAGPPQAAAAFQQDDLGIFRRNGIGSAVGRAVVHHDNIQREMCFSDPVQFLQTIQSNIFTIMGGNDRKYLMKRVRHHRSLSMYGCRLPMKGFFYIFDRHSPPYQFFSEDHSPVP